MILNILKNSVSCTSIRNKIMWSKHIISKLTHKLQFPHHFINKLRSYDVKRTLCYPMHMWLPTLRALHLSSFRIKQNQERIVTVHSFSSHSQNPVQNIKLSNNSLLALLPIPLNTPIINIGLVSNSLVLNSCIHRVMHIMALHQILLLVYIQQIFKQIATLRIFKQPLPILRHN